MVKGLTKQDLINWGISVEKSDDGYIIKRTGILNGFKKDLITRECTLHNFVGKHHYGQDKSYKGIAISVNGKPKVILVSRLLYVWFIEDIPDGYDVDHIDNNPFNNSLSNLQLLTRAENIAKRGIGRNQHTAGMSDEEILAKRNLVNKRKELNSTIAELNKNLTKLQLKWREVVKTDVVAARGYKKEIADFEARLKTLRAEKRAIIRKIKGE